MRLRLILESEPTLKVLKKHRRTLDDNEKEKVVKSKAVWSDGTSGVWKSKVGDSVYYVSNTHRTYSANKDINKTIKDFNDYVKDSS